MEFKMKITNVYWLVTRKCTGDKDIVCQEVVKDSRGVTVDVVWYTFDLDSPTTWQDIDNRYTFIGELEIDINPVLLKGKDNA